MTKASTAQSSQAVDPLPTPWADDAYSRRLEREHRCSEPSTRPGPRGSEGHYTIFTGPAERCARIDAAANAFALRHPGPECEGLLWCDKQIGRLQVRVGAEAMTCLEAEVGTPALCDHHAGASCIEPIVRKVIPAEDAAEACRPIVDHCQQLPSLDCERYVSSLRHCSAISEAMACLFKRCSLRACLDAFADGDTY